MEWVLCCIDECDELIGKEDFDRDPPRRVVSMDILVLSSSFSTLARQSSEMPPSTAKPLDQQSTAILHRLSQISPSKLSTLILQQPQVSTFLSHTLSKLVQRLLEYDSEPTQSEPFLALAQLLVNATKSPDPTLSKRLLGSSIDAIVHFVLLADNATQRPPRLNSILAALIDPAASNEFINASTKAFQKALDNGDVVQQRRAARITSALLRLLPLPRRAPANQKFQTAPNTSSADFVSLASVITNTHRSIDVSWNGIQASATKVATIDAAAALLTRLVTSDAQDGEIASVVLALAEPESASASSSSSKPLIDASILVDVCLAANPLLVDRLDSILRSAAQPQALAAWDQSRKVAASILGQARSRTDLASIGSAWKEITDAYRDLRLSNAFRAAKGKAKARDATAMDIPPSLKGMIDAILPHLSTDEARLKRILSRRKFTGKSDEETIQALLDDQASDSESEQGGETGTHTPYEPVATSNIYQPAVRANVFDDQPPLDESRMRWGNRRGDNDDDTASAPPSASLKASILARVKAQDEEDAADRQEWNPFAEDEERTYERDVGFEEELEDEQDRVNRRFAISNLGGERGNAGVWKKSMEDESEEEQDAEQEQGPTESSNAAQASRSAVSAERAAERILILAYSHNGPQVFSKDATARKSAARKALKANLESTTGKPYDDNLIESWGTMFERNVSTLLTLTRQIQLPDEYSSTHFTATKRRASYFSLLPRLHRKRQPEFVLGFLLERWRRRAQIRT